MGFRKAPVLLFLFAILVALLVLPFVPEKETASAHLETTTFQNTGTLLGENSPDLNPPNEAPSAPPDISPSGDSVSSSMKITVPALGLNDVAVPTGTRQAKLDEQGILHLRGSGLPWVAGSNTFVAGHALGFPRTRVPYAFYKLGGMKPGDEIFVDDTDGRRYTFTVYDVLTVEPGDYWVTYPVEGKTVISLQSCTPIPSFEDRLIVRGELVS